MSSLNRELLGQLKSLNGTITADTCLYILYKPIEWKTPRVDCKVNGGCEVTMICQCRFINCSKYTTVVGNVDNGGG